MTLFLSILALSLAIVTSYGATYYASPTGTDGAAGTLANPISLSKAVGNGMLASPAGPGDTIYLRGGTYSGGLVTDLNGTAGNPITIRAYQSERAIISTSTASTVLLEVQGSYIIIRDLEFRNLSTNRTVTRGYGIVNYGPYDKIINCLIHDTGTGIYNHTSGWELEINGCVFWYCGDQIADPTHSIYVASAPGHGVTLKDNISFAPTHNGINFGGGSAFTSDDGLVIGNTCFESGAIDTVSRHANVLAGNDSGTASIERLKVVWNYGYHRTGTEPNLTLGLYGVAQGSAICASNYFGGGQAFLVNLWTNLNFGYNTFSSTGAMEYNADPHVVSVNWDTNSYFSASATPFRLNGTLVNYANWQSGSGFDANSSIDNPPPPSNLVVVRPNDYETGRANITIFNWLGLNNVSVDLSAAMAVGSRYTIHNAADYFGPAVKTGTYSGGLLSLPMTNLTVATPVGISAPTATGPTFNAFVLTPATASTLLRVTNLTIRNP